MSYWQSHMRFSCLSPVRHDWGILANLLQNHSWHSPGNGLFPAELPPASELRFSPEQWCRAACPVLLHQWIVKNVLPIDKKSALTLRGPASNDANAVFDLLLPCYEAYSASSYWPEPMVHLLNLFKLLAVGMRENADIFSQKMEEDQIAVKRFCLWIDVEDHLLSAIFTGKIRELWKISYQRFRSEEISKVLFQSTAEVNFKNPPGRRI